MSKFKVKKVNLVASRPRFFPALRDLKKYLVEGGVPLCILDWEFPEFIHKESLSLIAYEAARHCALGLFQPVIVTTTGLFIKALNGFPGLHTGYVFRHVGNQGILKLLEPASDRIAYWKFIIAYCEPTRDPLIFRGVTQGVISDQERGSHGYVFDSIFIPTVQGNGKTFAENIGLKDQIGARWLAAQEFIGWWQTRRDSQ